jgi:uncharacterized membrane protein (UPF0127 family)
MIPFVAKMRAIRRLLLSLAMLGALAPLPACKNNGQPAPSAAPAQTATVTVVTAERKLPFHVELAITGEEQTRGLMFRQTLAADAGMLFVFDRSSVHTFWMKNTLIPLDMLFIGADKKIVGIVENAEPQTETGRSVGRPSLYVLEIGGGLSAQLGIRAGQTVEFQGVPATAPAP